MDHKAPFGPKRVGFGLRPQTTEGWLITLGFAIAVIVVAVILTAIL